MYKINILNSNNIITNSAEFSTQENCTNWYNQNVLHFPVTHTYVILDNSAQQESDEAIRYLRDTDWYIIREMDSGTPCPEPIKTARALARTKVI